LRDGATAKQAAKAAKRASKNYKARHGRWTRMRRAGGRWLLTRLMAWSMGVGGWLLGLVGLRRNTEAEAEGGDGRAERPRINTTVDRPENPAGEASGGETMGKGSTPGWMTLAEELGRELARYEPPEGRGGMVQFYDDVGLLPEMIEAIARGFSRMSDNAQGWPLHHAIVELIGELANAQAKIADTAGMIKPAMARLHDHDLERHHAPRPSESRWNV
jgi:hypothetical protein